jgi:hypothetical protein
LVVVVVVVVNKLPHNKHRHLQVVVRVAVLLVTQVVIWQYHQF